MSSGRLKMPILLRGCIGIGHSAATHHSGNYYPMYAHFPGLRVVVPSTPYDAKGLLHHALRVRRSGALPRTSRTARASRGRCPRRTTRSSSARPPSCARGRDVTVVALALHGAARRSKACEALAARGHLGRADRPAHGRAARYRDDPAHRSRKTGRLLIVDEAFAPFGIGAEIAAQVADRGFDDLDAPIRRLNGAAHADAVQPAAGGRRRPERRRRSPRRSATCWRSEDAMADPDHDPAPRLEHGRRDVRRLAEGRRRRRPAGRSAVQARRREGHRGDREPRCRDACTFPRTARNRARRSRSAR